MDKKIQILKVSLISSIFVIVFIVFATILSEVYKPFKNLLVDIFSHHWIGKSILSVLIFLFIWFLSFRFIKGTEPKDLEICLRRFIYIIILGFFSILLFFVWHFLA
jgi:uncharacterized membrane-anchored protein